MNKLIESLYLQLVTIQLPIMLLFMFMPDNWQWTYQPFLTLVCMFIGSLVLISVLMVIQWIRG